MDQVVCIDDRWKSWFFERPHPHPVKDSIYTIVGTDRTPEGVYYFLAEVSGGGCWHEEGFRPVRKTNISCFTGALKTKKLEDA